MHPDQVQLLQGTESTFEYSKGNTLPLVTRPWGMVNWTLQNAPDPWFFHPRIPKLWGIRATHQPSPWIRDYGAFTLLPQTGEISLHPFQRASSFGWGATKLHPTRLEVEFLRYRTKARLTPTIRGAEMEIWSTAARGPLRLFLDVPFVLGTTEGTSEIRLHDDGRGWTALLRNHHGGAPEGFTMWAVLQFSRPVDLFGGTRPGAEILGKREIKGEQIGAFAGWNVQVGEKIRVAIGTSFISETQAWLNLRNECLGFDEVRREGVGTWTHELGRIEVEGGGESQRLTLASCLYRTLLFPRIWHEPDVTGADHHYSPFDGKVHPGVLYTDNGFWDTHRTLFPWLHLVYPKRASSMLNGYANAVREGGWLPQWASPGYRRCMIGTHSDAVIADAVAKQVPDLDLPTLYEGMLKHARTPPPSGRSRGRTGLVSWRELGYIAADEETHASAAGTLDYAYDDWCIAQVARHLGDEAVALEFEASAGNYRHLFDANTGFFRGRNRNGNWREPWSPIMWGNEYIEGSAWQTLFNVPHDPAGLAQLLGGPEALTAKLEAMLDAAPEYESGSYRGEIHEMTEMALAHFGQYAHSNQPSHGALWYFAAAGGEPRKTQYWTRRITSQCYDASTRGFPGDEDNGEMAAWFCFAALGFYPFCPGSPYYLIGSPLFDRAQIRLPEGRHLTIVAEGQGEGRACYEELTWNDQPFEGPWLPHALVAKGGVLFGRMR